MDKQVTPQKAVTSITWGPPPPCEQALSLALHVLKNMMRRIQFEIEGDDDNLHTLRI